MKYSSKSFQYLGTQLKIFWVKCEPVLTWFGKDVLLPGFSTLLAFLVFGFLYQLVTGVNVSRFAPEQISDVISDSTEGEFDLFKIDFYGFGVESFVAVSSSWDDEDHDLQIKVYDEVQANPLQRFLFGDKLYGNSFSFQVSNSGNLSYFSQAIPVNFTNRKKRLFFCINSDCGFLQNARGKFEIIPALDIDFYCSKPAEIISNLGKTELSRIPDESRVFFKDNDTQFFLAAPISSKTTSVLWDNFEDADPYWAEAKYQICKYLYWGGEKYASLNLSGDHGGDFCYRTNDFYFKDIHNGAFSDDNVKAKRFEELEKEIERNVPLIWPEYFDDFCPELERNGVGSQSIGS